MIRRLVLGVCLTIAIAGCARGPSTGGSEKSGETIKPAETSAPDTAPNMLPAIIAPPTLDDASARILVDQFTLYGNSALTDPRRGVVEAVYDPTCPCYKGAQEQVEELIIEEWRFAQGPVVIKDVKVIDQPYDGYVVLSVSSDVLETEILTYDDLVVDLVPGVHEEITMTVGYSNGRWRVLDRTSTYTPAPTIPPPIP